MGYRFSRKSHAVLRCIECCSLNFSTILDWLLLFVFWKGCKNENDNSQTVDYTNNRQFVGINGCSCIYYEG